MTVTLVGPSPTETFASPRLAYRNLLVAHRDAMVEGLVEKHNVPRTDAELMIDQLWERLTDRLVKEYAHLGVDLPLAERIMNEALGFLQLASRHAGHGPSPLVDLGWHTFMVYSMEYFVFCDAIAGHYIHHLPDDVVGLNASAGRNCSSPKPEPGGAGGCNNKPNCIKRGTAHEYHSLQETIETMKALGPIDLDLWTRNI